MITPSALGHFVPNEKGYARFSSGPYRNKYVHRVVWTLVAGHPPPPGWHVHHQVGKCFCPHNLIAMPAELNPSVTARRCPYTGKFMTAQEYRTTVLGENPWRETGAPCSP